MMRSCVRSLVSSTLRRGLSTSRAASSSSAQSAQAAAPVYRPRRALLYMPGSSPKMLQKATTLEVDTVSVETKRNDTAKFVQWGRTVQFDRSRIHVALCSVASRLAVRSLCVLQLHGSGGRRGREPEGRGTRAHRPRTQRLAQSSMRATRAHQSGGEWRNHRGETQVAVRPLGALSELATALSHPR